MRFEGLLTSYTSFVVAGVFAGLSIVFPSLWFFVFVVLVPFFFYLRGNKASALGALFRGSLFGVALIGICLQWFFFTLPLSWLGIDDLFLGFSIVFFSWLFFVLPLGIISGLTAVVAFLVARHLRYPVLVFSLLWPLFEVFRVFVYSVLAYGTGSTFGIDFSFGFLGYALAWSDVFVGLSKFGGVYALNIFVILVNIFVYFALIALLDIEVSSRKKVSYAALLIVALSLSHLLPRHLYQEEYPSVIEINGVRLIPLATTVDPYIFMTDVELKRGEYLVLNEIKKALQNEPDVIILPEYVRFFRNLRFLSESRRNDLLEDLASRHMLLIDSAKASVEDGGYGTILFYDTQRQGVVETQKKRFLIPFGEYLPEAFIRFFRIIGLEQELIQIIQNRTYRPFRGPVEERVFEFNGLRMGVLACSESFSPTGYLSLARNGGVDVLVNISSQSWMRNNAWPALFNQTLAMARIHAVWAQKPFIQATNHGPSFVIYPK